MHFLSDRIATNTLVPGEKFYSSKRPCYQFSGHHRTYLVMNRRWNSDRSVSLTKPFSDLSSIFAQFLKTTSSSHLLDTEKSPACRFRRGFPFMYASVRVCSASAAFCSSRSAASSARSCLIFCNSRRSSASSSSSSSSELYRTIET